MIANHKAEHIVVDWIQVVLHNCGLELHVGPRHEVDPNVVVAPPLEVRALNNRDINLFWFRLISNLTKRMEVA